MAILTTLAAPTSMASSDPAPAAPPSGLDAVLADRPEPPAPLVTLHVDSIRSWRGLGTRGLLLEAQNDRWYLIRFHGSCPELRNADSMAFVTDPNGRLSKFDAIQLEDGKCLFKSLDEITLDEANALRRRD